MMLREETAMTESAKFETRSEDRCDVRVWADSCQRSEFSSRSDKYLCASCGTIPVLDREMHHEHFPHLSGDKDSMY
jgi:hypothetical protein